MFSGLSVLGDSSFEFSNTGSDNQNGAIGLRGSSNHVLDEISVTGGVDDGNVELKISYILEFKFYSMDVKLLTKIDEF